MPANHRQTRDIPQWAGPSAPVQGFWQKLFSSSAGSLLGLALLKFGNPVTFDQLIGRPDGIWEMIFQPWPIAWGYVLLAGLVVLSVKSVRFLSSAPRWVVFLPLGWFGWQLVSGLFTIEPALTRSTLLHFGSCVVWFYLGLFAFGQGPKAAPFWAPIVAAFLLVLWIAFEQHYGGLEATRRYFYEQPDWQKYPPEYLKRMASDRVFSTLVYPNALAGAILLYLPGVVAATWMLGRRLPMLSRSVATGLLAYSGVACMVWSGSKSGWLIALVMAVFALVQFKITAKAKIAVAIAICVLGLAGFAMKFTTYFQKGATSVAARFDYWRAALTIAKQNPVFGSGPGTFSVNYAKIKPPEAEMARLVHNDYLEQACDSGIPGIAGYFTLVFGIIYFLYRERSLDRDPLAFMLWLGLLGWALQSFVEFPLYIPGLAWPSFALLGWSSGEVTSKSNRQAVGQ